MSLVQLALAARTPSALAPRIPTLLTIVVPTYNESANIRLLAKRLDQVLGETGWEMVIVDDDSPDGTHAVAKSMARRDPRIRCLRRIGRRGLSGACIEGMLSSSSPYVAVMDGDLQHDETILPRMLEALREGSHDLVIGSRLVEGGDAASGFGRARQWISHTGARLSRLALRTDVRDTMSGFFMIRRDIADELVPKLCTDGFKILADILATAGPSLRVQEVGYSFRERHGGESKLDAKVALDFLGLILNKITGGTLPVSFVGFALVGVSGLIVHLAVLYAAMQAGTTFVAAQTCATLISIVSNFALNNSLTYRASRLRGWRWARGLLMFSAICSLSAVANIGVAAWVFEREQTWIVAGLAGVLMGAVWNYAVSTKFVWRA
jgi:dolichol-phosphate mannosyltransferase